MIKLPKPPHFSFQECLWFLNRNYDDCLYKIRNNSVIKLIQLERTSVLFEVTENKDYLIINILNGAKPKEAQLKAYVADWFDLDRDLTPFYALLQKDNDLAFMATAYHGLRLMSIPDLFESLCWSIIGQQINLTFAYKCKRALVEKYSQSVQYQGENYYLFPTPNVAANFTVEELRNLQFSRQKSTYIIGIAQLFVNQKINKKRLLELTDEAAIEKELIKIKGVGAWTANYAMMKCLKTPNALPYGDVGLYNALHAIKDFPKRPSREQLDAFFAPFENWKAYLVHYLWRTLAEPKY